MIESDEAAPVGRVPDVVRRHVVDLVSDLVGRLPAEEVPPSLRRIAAFTPSKRARLGGASIVLAVEQDRTFRERIATALREGVPDLAGALEAGSSLPLLPPEEVAAAAYVLRPVGWERIVADAAREIAEQAASATRDAEAGVAARLREQLEAGRAERRADTERWRTEIAAARAESGELRRRLGEARERARSAESAATSAQEAAAAKTKAALASVTAAETTTRRLRARLAESEAALDGARRAAREERGAGDLRVRLLLDAVERGARGLRDELGLPVMPPNQRPADGLPGAAPEGGSWLDVEDRAALDAVLLLPLAHLVIDGYNVTKGGYGTLPLEDQRSRLVTALGGLSARTGAEITVVFDGADVTGVRVPESRGVRVRFSAAGQIADDYIRDLVAREPQGRVVAVVSSDREVADGVRRSGALAFPSSTLLRLLERS